MHRYSDDDAAVGSRIPDSKYYRPDLQATSKEWLANIDDLLSLWETRFEQDLASLIASAAGDAYKTKIEGWDYRKTKHHAAAMVACRISFLSKDRKSKLYATYDFFPFLENKAVAISPTEPENPARITLDGILTGAGYVVVERDSKAA